MRSVAHSLSVAGPQARTGLTGSTARILPGVLLCLAVAVAATMLGWAEAWVFGRAWLEPLVLAILLGTILRTARPPAFRWTAGIEFSARTLLEVAVVLLGASVSAQAVLAAGPVLLGGIAAVVVVAIVASYAIGRALGLPHRMATLVACGNSICGNSAIAAVAPVIGASGAEVTASIAFTAVLGVAVVLLLPLAVPLLHLTVLQYGALAGLTVYAVPQVLAATAPFGPLAVQLGTLVKLMRVLMLGPVILALSALSRRRHDKPDTHMPAAGPHLHRLVPWFIVGFLALAAIRAAGWVPPVSLGPIATTANLLTVVAMAALGLGTDLRAVRSAGGRVTSAVVLSLLTLGAVSFGLIRLLGLA